MVLRSLFLREGWRGWHQGSSTGLCGVGSATPNWALGVASVSASAKSSETFLGFSSPFFLCPFLTLFSLAFPHPFPWPFLTLFSLRFPHPFPHPVSMQTTEFWRIPGEVAELWPHTRCFIPACPCPLSQPSLRGRSCHRWPLGLEDFTPGMKGLGFLLPEMIKVLKNPALVAQPQPQLPARPSRDKAALVAVPISIPEGSKSLSKHPPRRCEPGALWLCSVLGVVFPPRWHLGNGFLLSPELEELRGPSCPWLCPIFPPRNKTRISFFFSIPSSHSRVCRAEGRKNPVPR